VEEAAMTLGVHKNTVRNWIRQGLPVIDEQRPALIHGAALKRFLEERRKRSKQPCPPGHIYCVRCREPKAPAGDIAEYLPITSTSGNLRGICPDCETLIHQRVALARIDEFRANLEITFPQAWERIGDRSSASLDCDSGMKERADDNA